MQTVHLGHKYQPLPRTSPMTCVNRGALQCTRQSYTGYTSSNAASLQCAENGGARPHTSPVTRQLGEPAGGPRNHQHPYRLPLQF